MKCGNKHCLVCSMPVTEGYSSLKARARALSNERTELRKKLAWSRRSNRRMVYKYLSKNWELKHLVEGEPSLEAVAVWCRKVWKRLLAIRKVRKERLMREMPEHERNALGLTPPQHRQTFVGGYGGVGGVCKNCIKPYGVHKTGNNFELSCP